MHIRDLNKYYNKTFVCLHPVTYWLFEILSYVCNSGNVNNLSIIQKVSHLHGDKFNVMLELVQTGLYKIRSFWTLTC